MKCALTCMFLRSYNTDLVFSISHYVTTVVPFDERDIFNWLDNEQTSQVNSNS